VSGLVSKQRTIAAKTQQLICKGERRGNRSPEHEESKCGPTEGDYDGKNSGVRRGNGKSFLWGNGEENNIHPLEKKENSSVDALGREGLGELERKKGEEY